MVATTCSALQRALQERALAAMPLCDMLAASASKSKTCYSHNCIMLEISQNLCCPHPGQVGITHPLHAAACRCMPVLAAAQRIARASHAALNGTPITQWL